jgi:hypothetical protein
MPVLLTHGKNPFQVLGRPGRGPERLPPVVGAGFDQ